MNSAFPNSEGCSYRTMRFSGTYSICLDSDKVTDKFDGCTIKGVPLSPSNDLLITYNTTVPSAGNFTHYALICSLKVWYCRDGVYYTSPI